MAEDDTEAAPPSPADERRRARLAQIEQEQEHARSLIDRYGRESGRERFAVVGHARGKRRRR